MIRYLVRVFFTNEEETLVHLGAGEFFAENESEARERAYKKFWDTRLDATGCSPEIYCRQIGAQEDE